MGGIGISMMAAAVLMQPAAQQEQGQTITVIGERIRDLEASLAACLARNCPPNEDVDATLALAEGQFMNGDYDDAVDVIETSLSRNRRHTRAYPEPVADLYRSHARVQSHRGRDPQARRSIWNILAALREGIPQEDHRHFTARLEIIDMLIRAGNLRGAREELGTLRDRATQARRQDVARVAAMRLLRIDYLVNPNGPALRRLEELARTQDPERRYEMVSSRVWLSRIYRDRGDHRRADQMLAGLPRSTGSDRRALLVSPPYSLPDVGATYPGGIPSGSVTNRVAGNYEGNWIDVGFWIRSDGRVEGLEVVRRGASADWAEGLLRSIGGRVYAEGGDPAPSYRLERYTYTAPFEVVTGSRIAQRSRQARVEYLDLTAQGEAGRAPDPGVRPRGR